MRYTLRQIEVFLATAHHENITRAAESLNMSQSAASGALRELEQQYSLQLFERAGKRLRLNELGSALRPQAEALLAQARDLENSLHRRQAVGTLNVGATLTIGNYLAVGIMARFMRQHAGARVQLEVANTATIARKLANFELDIGLVEGEIQHPQLDITPWREDELVVFCHPEHPLARHATVGDEELLSADWIVRESGSGTRQTFDRAMHGLIPRLTIALELQHTEAIKRAVEAQLGVGCLSRVTLEDAFRRGSLVPLNVPGRDFRRHFYFVLHRDKYRSEGIRQWMSLCRNETP
jgi:DNA-binding transcriptional LysR family regulator